MTTRATTRRRSRASRAMALPVGSLLALTRVAAAAAGATPVTYQQAPFSFD